MQPQQHLKERGHGLLGKLSLGAKKLEEKTFYLDNVKKQPTAQLLEAISVLGGVSMCYGILPLDPSLMRMPFKGDHGVFKMRIRKKLAALTVCATGNV